MAASVIGLFDRQPFIPSADRSDEATLRRVKIAAMATGCDARQVKLTRAHAEGLLRGGMAPHLVIPAARSYAEQLLTNERAPTTEGAA